MDEPKPEGQPEEPKSDNASEPIESFMASGPESGVDFVYRNPTDGRYMLAEVKVSTPEELRRAFGQAQAMIAGVIDSAASSNSRITQQQIETLRTLAEAQSDRERIRVLEEANATFSADLKVIHDQITELAKPQEIIRAASEAIERQVDVLDRQIDVLRTGRKTDHQLATISIFVAVITAFISLIALAIGRT